MNCNPLIFWMATVGGGTWAAFKRAVTTLASEGLDVAAEARRLRVRFSELGFGEFFIRGREGWRAFRPMLVASPHRPNDGFLSGARTEAVVERLRASAPRFGCRFFEVVSDGFTNIRVYGDRIAEAARAAELPFEPDIGQRLARELVPLERGMLAGPRTPPSGWSVRSFDLSKRRWVDGWLPGTATEHTSTYEERLYFVQAPDAQHFQLPKRDAVFAAAWLNNVAIAEYENEGDSAELRTPAAAPLPDACSRAACLAGGRPSEVRGGWTVYKNVPPQLAAAILVSLNHLAPRFHFCGEPAHGRGR
jgi:hypothetical protein